MMLSALFPIALLASLALADSHQVSTNNHHQLESKKRAAFELVRSDLIVSRKVNLLEEEWVDSEDDDEFDDADAEAWAEVDEDDLEDALDIYNDEPKKNKSLSKKSSIPGGFKGTQKGYGSWFRANSGSDSTNGKSWCGVRYNNASPIFAAKFGIMSPSHATWSKSPKQWSKDGKKVCGLQAKVWWTDNKGHKRTKYLYMADAFDDAWVRTKGSIDILKTAWAGLHGSSTSNKNVVMKNVQWKLTGKRSKKYRFQG